MLLTITRLAYLVCKPHNTCSIDSGQSIMWSPSTQMSWMPSKVSTEMLLCAAPPPDWADGKERWHSETAGQRGHDLLRHLHLYACRTPDLSAPLTTGDKIYCQPFGSDTLASKYICFSISCAGISQLDLGHDLLLTDDDWLHQLNRRDTAPFALQPYPFSVQDVLYLIVERDAGGAIAHLQELGVWQWIAQLHGN